MCARVRSPLLRLRAAVVAAPEPFTELAGMGLADPRAMGTDAMTGDHTMKVKTHVRAGILPPPPGGGRCGA
jgi:hypothetical protein